MAERDKELSGGAPWVWFEGLSMSLDLEDMGFEPFAWDHLAPRLRDALGAMAALEAGSVANADEKRQVGHYWLRTPEAAPEPEMTAAIGQTQQNVRRLAQQLRDGTIRTPEGESFERAVFIGIGGSALGPQLLVDALGSASPSFGIAFVDNTDPDGIDRVLERIGAGLGRTVFVVLSKSGGTVETKNGMLEMRAAVERANLEWPARAIAITQKDSALDRLAERQGWLERLFLWPWVGGRTSVTSAVGLLPLALMGGSVQDFIEGAAQMDEACRTERLQDNPAVLLAGSWFLTGGGRGERAMVVLPYRDRLSLFARYLQQLVMESLGKAFDRQGQQVHQGLTVYGNKGSTDQHAYVQQLLDGSDDFFATFVEVLSNAKPGREVVKVAEGVTTSDYLSGFLHGTRAALSERGRPHLLLTLDRLDESALGGLIALYERAVGLYAELVDVNAYHQPAVESGKRAARQMIALMAELHQALEQAAEPRTAEELASHLERDARQVVSALRHMAAQPCWGLRVERSDGQSVRDARYRIAD